MTDFQAPLSLVLGGTGYIGSALCELLAQEGEETLFTYCSNEKKAQELASRFPTLHGYFLDFRIPSSLSLLLEGFEKEAKRFQGVAFCTGTPGETSLYEGIQNLAIFETISESAWNDLMDINLKSIFFFCQKIQTFLLSPSNLVFVGAMAGVKAVPSPVHYAVSKGGLSTFTESLSKVLGEKNICVNTVAPGILEGGIAQLLPASLKEEYRKHCSLGRLGKAKEVAEVLAWFLRENTYINGQSLLLDGGL
jgi:3-oxoacyl-[acyl-carrier protein] reductase